MSKEEWLLPVELIQPVMTNDPEILKESVKKEIYTIGCWSSSSGKSMYTNLLIQNDEENSVSQTVSMQVTYFSTIVQGYMREILHVLK